MTERVPGAVQGLESALFEELLDFALSRKEPVATGISAWGAIPRDRLELREERGFAVASELRGEVD